MISSASETPVQGHVEDGWGKVADAFRANFAGNPGEVGAACSVYAGGRRVVKGALFSHAETWNIKEKNWTGRPACGNCGAWLDKIEANRA